MTPRQERIYQLREKHGLLICSLCQAERTDKELCPDCVKFLVSIAQETTAEIDDAIEEAYFATGDK